MTSSSTSRTGTIELFEISVLPCVSRASLAFHGEPVDIGAREPIEGGDHIGADSLRRKVVVVRDPWIRGPCAAVGAHHGSRHRFNAAADGGLVLAGHDLRRGRVDRFERRRTEAMNLLAGNGLSVSGEQHPRPGDVAALLADGLGASHDDIVDQRGVELVALLESPQHLLNELYRADLVQRAVGTAAPARSAHVIVDEGVSHRVTPRVKCADAESPST